jgi:hypothetical protein
MIPPCRYSGSGSVSSKLESAMLVPPCLTLENFFLKTFDVAKRVSRTLQTSHRFVVYP